MKLHRIQGFALRFLYLFRHSLDRINDIFYWPVIDLLLWGLTSKYLQVFAPSAVQIVLMIISGVLFWRIMWRAQHEISVNVLEELWNKNLINLFAAPIKFSEWVTSLIFIGITKGIVSFIFGLIMAYILFKIQLFLYGFYLLPFLLLLFMTGWWVGFLVSGIILRMGTRVQTFAWAVMTVLSPFSAIYYPLSILPDWAQKVALLIPSSYIFEGVREVIATGTLDPNKLYMSFILNIVYLIISIIYLRKSFDKILERGLVNVY